MPKPARAIDIARRAAIDEFGRLDARVKEWKPTLDRHKKLKEEIRSWYDNEDEQREFVAEGAGYVATITARENKTSIVSMAKVKTRLGVKRFLELCSFTLKNLDLALSKDEQDGLVKTERAGSRDVSVVSKVVV